MLTYLCETHFWTNDEDITIKHTDLGAFRYDSKKHSSPSIYLEGKKLYAEKRGQTWTLPTKRPLKLKDCLRELTELLKDHRLIYCRWESDCWLCLIFSTGTIVYVCVNPATADITRILFDRYLVGKLLSANVSEVLFTNTHILLTYNDNQAILVNFNRPSIKSTVPEKLSNRDPKFQTVELVGGWRRGGRQVSGSAGGGSALVWSRASPSDLFPWSPRAPHEDHANVHVYSLQGSQISLMCFHRIEFDPLCVSFSKIHENVIFSVEQKTSRKGGVIVECRRLEVDSEGGSMQSPDSTANGEDFWLRLAAPAPATCASRSPCEQKLLIACTDRSVLLHHCKHNVTTTVTAAFVGRSCCWSGDGTSIAVGGSGAQLQCWDSSLTPASLSPPVHHAPAEPLLDLTSYFRKEPTMTHLLWNQCRKDSANSSGFLSEDGLLLAVMQGGPLLCIRLFSASAPQEEVGIVGGIRGAESSALARLRSLDWVSNGPACLALLHRIFNSLFTSKLTLEREEIAQAALGTFLAPQNPLPPATRLAHLPHLRDLCRRFFHQLIRYGRLDKALCLAIDVGHHDLFMDVHFAAKVTGNLELANEARLHAEDAASSCESSCSRPSCSRCSGSTDSGSEEEFIHEEGPAPFTAPLPGQMDLYGASQLSNTAPRTTRTLSHRTPPPLPYLPPSRPPLPRASSMSTNLNSSNILRPKHDPVFSDREIFPGDLSEVAPTVESRVMHRVVEIIPQVSSHVKEQSGVDLFQTELAESACSIERHHRTDRPRMNLNPLKAESLINIYTPVYHQYPSLSARIPLSNSSRGPHSRFLANDNDFISTPIHSQNNNREPSGIAMQNMRDLLVPPLMQGMRADHNSNSANDSRVSLMPPLSMIAGNRGDYIPMSMAQIKRDFPLNMNRDSAIRNGVGIQPTIAKGPTPVIKSTGVDGESSSPAKQPGEKNKVKFSDTVTVAVVPEIPRKDRRTVRSSVGPSQASGAGGAGPDPRRELADSLPLCHPHREYLKDFSPQPETEEQEKQSKIKVVHFGVV